MEEIEVRQAKEMQELQAKMKEMVKKAKKSEKAIVEAQAIQMEFDLKAKHREEMEDFEESHGFRERTSSSNQKSLHMKEVAESLHEIDMIESKKEKAKRKKDKKVQKEKERDEMKQQIQSTASLVKSPREIEMELLSLQLSRDHLLIQDIPSDGHCLYRAISHQLHLSHHHHLQASQAAVAYDYKMLRKLAATWIRTHAEDYIPFLGMIDAEDPKFLEYLQKIEDDRLAEWGGQLEIRALSEALSVTIIVYSADAPKLIMQSESSEEKKTVPLLLSYHRHIFFALGEHYNSLIPGEAEAIAVASSTS